ncbi:AMP-binding protein [Paraburkholderia sp. ZP32-5]|uniref:AMP-binding protein n=1 Tax=Paraburkholderia sp. ZP32-5 TaxID=2883245 RepID=UPI001F1F4072|nr:AMP-binding protein [Paraburkholderia sp. ZP32-5]
MDHADRWRFAKRRANFEPLSPISFLKRTARIFPDRTAIVYGDLRRTYAEMESRCRRLSSFIDSRGLGQGDVVSVMLPNLPEMVELHFAAPANGRILHTVSTRLDANGVRFQLQHSKSKLLVFDAEYAGVIEAAVADMTSPPILVELVDRGAPVSVQASSSAHMSYEQALALGDDSIALQGPEDEWQPIALSYTSGTTGNPKGVVTHHRGAYLNAVANVLAWSVPAHPVYLWVLGMFHCDGWCFPWTITHQAGTHVCLRKVDPALIFTLSETERVTHLCAAPVVLSMLTTEAHANHRRFAEPVDILTAGAPPAAPIIGAIESINARITQVYGLTETYASTTFSAWRSEWDTLPPQERHHRKARQGVEYPACEELGVIDAFGNQVPWDGETVGEVVVRGNTVMAGYLDNPAATDEALANGWFHTGDLATRDDEGYISIRDRIKDIINSGGEKISSIEIEDVLFEHPDLLE